MILRLRLAVLPVLAFLTGCSTATHPPVVAVPALSSGFRGSVHGGQQPITGATIQIYAVGTTGDGSPATSVLAASLTTDGNGFFDLTNKVTCPTPSSLLYLVATGGNPGLPPPFSGSQISLITALGQCSNPNNIQFINVNEVTTVAAIYALAPFMTGLTAIGSSSANAPALSATFDLAWQFANITTGTSPGVNIPADTTIPTAQINTLANILSACVNSSGGVAGDSSFCGQLFTLLTLPGGTAPTDAAMALLNLAISPSLNTSGLYNLAPAAAPFQPALTAPPSDFNIQPTSLYGLVPMPASYDFGTIPVGFTKFEQYLYARSNYTRSDIAVNVYLVGPDAGDFAVSGPSGFTCLPNGIIGSSSYYQCVLTPTFTATSPGFKRAYIVIPYSNPDVSGTLVIPLSGTGQ